VKLVLAAVVSAALALTACGGSGGKQGASGAGASSSDVALANADDIAASFQRRAGSWATSIQNAVSSIADYPSQIDAKKDSRTQLATQVTYCGTAQNALGTASRPPVLDPAPPNSSAIYAAAKVSAAKLPALAKAVHADLATLFRFCTWLNTFESGEADANRANSELFNAPLRYTGSTEVKGVKHTCPAGASCYTPDQSQWPKIATLWRASAAGTAKGPQAIQKDKIACLFEGWDDVCTLVVQDQLDYAAWADTYARAFDDGKGEPLAKANAVINVANARFTREVLAPLSPLGHLYAQLAPGHKYDARASLLGKDIWIAQITALMAQLKKDSAALG
jgi:hypothetical protein